MQGSISLLLLTCRKTAHKAAVPAAASSSGSAWPGPNDACTVSIWSTHFQYIGHQQIELVKGIADMCSWVERKKLTKWSA